MSILFETGFAFVSGLSSGPLLDLAIRINPTILPNALALAGVIFASFSGAALMAPEGHYLYLGGTLVSGLSALFWMGLANIFFQSQMLFQVCPSKVNFCDSLCRM